MPVVCLGLKRRPYDGRDVCISADFACFTASSGPSSANVWNRVVLFRYTFRSGRGGCYPWTASFDPTRKLRTHRVRWLFQRTALAKAANIHFQLIVAAQAGLDEAAAEEPDIHFVFERPKPHMCCKIWRIIIPEAAVLL